MSHIDDGLLHAYLDGALHAEDPAEAERVERHLAVCDDCRARLDAARQLRAEADVLLEAATPTDLDMPPFEAIAERARARAADTGPSRTGRAGEAPVDADGRAAADERTTRRRQHTLTRTLAWAASIVMALGMGWWARELAFQPGGLPQSPTEQIDGVPGTTNALETAAPSAKARSGAAAANTPNAAQSPAAAKQAAYEAEQAPAPTAAAQPTKTAGRGTAADQQAGGAVTRQPGAGLAPAAQKPKAAAEEPSEAPEAEALARKVEAALASPSLNLPTAVAQSNAVARMAPAVATDAAMGGKNLSGGGLRLMTVDEASAWLGGPLYGVGGLDVLGVMPYNTPDGARAVTVYQRLSGSDTLGLHQLRPMSGNAFTLGPGVTGVVRDGTLVYARAALPPDSLRALLRRLVPLRH